MKPDNSDIRIALDTLIQHNKWRRDKHVPPKSEMVEPKQLGIAIDKIVKYVKDTL